MAVGKREEYLRNTPRQILSITVRDEEPRYQVETIMGPLRLSAKELLYQNLLAKQVLRQHDRMWPMLHDMAYRIQVLEAAHG